MGREVRMVPANWQAPKRTDGRDGYQPHYDQDYRSAVQEWKDGYEDWKTNPQSDCEYWDWNGGPPDEDYYRPSWTDEERTHCMMYETTSEGTPISPAFATPEELARWLADTGASSFGYMTASYEQWLRVCQGGYAPSMVADVSGLRSGVVEGDLMDAVVEAAERWNGTYVE